MNGKTAIVKNLSMLLGQDVWLDAIGLGLGFDQERKCLQFFYLVFNLSIIAFCVPLSNLTSFHFRQPSSIITVSLIIYGVCSILGFCFLCNLDHHTIMAHNANYLTIYRLSYFSIIS